MKTLKEKVNSNDEICGMLVTLADPSVCEMVGYLGYDFIWVDMEHSYLSCKDVFIHANAARATGTPIIVRVPQHDLSFTKRILETGVEGIIFPMVHSASEAEELLSYTLYPPRGDRGFGPQRAIRYYLDDANEYAHDGHLKLCRFIQIEHFGAVDDIEKIAQMPYLDGVFFGPNDLSASIGRIGDFYCEENMALIKRSIEVLKKYGKAIGVALGAADEKTLAFWRDLGINILVAGQDYGMLQMTALENVKRLKKAQNRVD